MKSTRIFVLIGFVTVISLAAACWCVAQTSAPATKPVTGDSNPELDRLTALVSYLETEKQTNALKLFYEYANASLAQQHSADMGVTLHVLMALRDGHTNEAMALLEGRLDVDIVGFATSYMELPNTQQEWLGVRSLSDAKWYRDKFSREDAYGSVAQAFKLLDKKSRK
jgi:hypothetical protein